MKLVPLVISLSLFVCGLSAENPLKVDGRSFYGADPSALVASDGKVYRFPTTDDLVWDNQIGWSVYSTEDLINWKDEGIIFDNEDSGWATNNAWAPDIVENNGIYYFTIARAWNNLIYYTADNVLGPYEFRGEFMKPYGGNNHHSIVKYKGRWILFYHEWVKGKPGHAGHQRRIRAEYLYFKDDGSIQLVEPTHDGISLETLEK